LATAYVYENKQPEHSEAKPKAMLPDLGNRMVKVQEIKGKVQNGRMVKAGVMRCSCL
jgi:hypothetical protein